MADRIAEDELIEVEIVVGADRIRRHPPTHPRCVVAEPEVVESGGVVAFLTAVPVLPQRDFADGIPGDHRRTAVGEVFFVRDDLAGVVELERGRSLAVFDLVAKARARDVIGLAREVIASPSVDQREMLHTVGDVGRPALENGSTVARDAEQLLIAEVELLGGLDGATLDDTRGDPARALASGVVDVALRVVGAAGTSDHDRTIERVPPAPHDVAQVIELAQVPRSIEPRGRIGDGCPGVIGDG